MQCDLLLQTSSFCVFFSHLFSFARKTSFAVNHHPFSFETETKSLVRKDCLAFFSQQPMSLILQTIGISSFAHLLICSPLLSFWRQPVCCRVTFGSQLCHTLEVTEATSVFSLPLFIVPLRPSSSFVVFCSFAVESPPPTPSCYSSPNLRAAL